jgi:Ca-activated chloride channel family protein
LHAGTDDDKPRPVRLASPILLAALLLVPLLIGVVVFDARRRALRLAKLVDAGLVPAVVVGASSMRRARLAVTAIIAVLLLVIAAAGPMVAGTPRLLPRKGLDVLFVVDVSRSMRARDVRPDRLERAKAEIGRALDTLAEHRIGVVAFAGSAFVQCPLTTDVEAVRLFLRDLSPDTVPQGGTDLTAGLEVARNALVAEDEAAGISSSSSSSSSGGRGGRVVVVVSDGEDHEIIDGGSLDAVGKELKDLGAAVVVLGVGSTIGEPIPVTDDAGNVTGYVKDRTGQTVVTRMNPEILQKAADVVGGVFVDGTTRNDLGLAEVEARIRSLEKRDLEARTIVDYADASAPFAALALVALLGWLLIPERVA